VSEARTRVGDATPDPARVSVRRAQTRERLMTAARTVFADRGIDGASVEEICEAAGFTRGAFYSNFADKDALVLALIIQGIQTGYAHAEQAIVWSEDAPGALTPAERVGYVLAQFEAAEGGEREHTLAQQEMLLHAARQPALREPYLKFVAASSEQLTGLISYALQTVELEFTLPFGEAIELLIATHSHVQMQALFTGRADFTVLRSLVMAITRPARAE
jgi:AcrR family transcriptional regulator